MQGFSERIYKEASRMITLVGDIIKLSKLDEGSVELEKENVDLYQMTREIVSRLALQAEKRRIQVEVVGELVECFGIRQILDEMIYNICENAIKYNKDNGKVNIWKFNLTCTGYIRNVTFLIAIMNLLMKYMIYHLRSSKNFHLKKTMEY